MKTLVEWFTTQNNGQRPVMAYDFGPSGIVEPAPVPQMPSPTGVLGGAQPDFNKLSRYPAAQIVFAGSAQRLTRF